MIFDISSLERLSLNCIENNFSCFLSNYGSSENGNLIKNLLFLQRAYTQQLFCDLGNNGKLQRELHLDFLLNEHLRQLDISRLLNLGLNEEDILEKVIPIAHSLQELSYFDICDDNSSVAFILLEKMLPHSINVTKVALFETCNDKLLECIVSSCPGLVELDIDESTVTGKGIKTLCSNSNGFIEAKCPIKIINLMDTSIELDDVAFLLKNLPTLEKERYERLPSVIESLYLSNRNENTYKETVTFNLLSLDFIGYRSEELKRVLEVCAETCPNLKTLSGSVETDHLKLMCGFSNLENLTLYCSQSASAKYVCINDFLTLIGKKLKTLRLDFFSLSASVLVEHCPNLESLVLNKVFFHNSSEDCVKSLRLLRSLYLKPENPKSVDRAPYMKFSYFCPNLENLYLVGTYSETDFEEMLKLSCDCNLKRLSFRLSNVKFDFLIRLIINCKSLRDLSLRSCLDIKPHQNCQLKECIDTQFLKIRYSFRY